MKAISWNGADVYPSKIVCIGRNYVEHIEELNNEIPDEPVIFIKPNSSIATEIYTNEVDDIHFEGEITFLIEAGEISGVAFGLDLTKREIQAELKSKGLPWERAKSFDNSAVFSDFVPFNGDLSELKMELLINDQLAQEASYALMLYKPGQLVDEIKSFISLEDGDLIMSGTPKGVGIVNPGDKFIGRIFEKEKLLVENSWLAK